MSTQKRTILGSPISLGYQKAWNEEQAIAQAKKTCPLIKDGASLCDFRAELSNKQED